MAIHQWGSDERNLDGRRMFKSFVKEPKLGPCLFVSRETGAEGGEIARRAAESLRWDLLDKEVLNELSSKYGTSRIMLDAVDEKKVDWLTDLLNGWLEGKGFSQLAYVHRLRRLFVAAAKRGDVVIVGRGARFMLPRRAGFSVRIVAPLDERIRRIAARFGKSSDEARDYVLRMDKLRSNFLQSFFHHDVSDASIHDLVINTEQLGIENSVDLLLTGLRSWLKMRPPARPLGAPHVGAAWPPLVAPRA